MSLQHCQLSSHTFVRVRETFLGLREHSIDCFSVFRGHEGVTDVGLSEHLHELGEPRQVEFFIPESKHKKEASRLAIEGVKIYPSPGSAQDHEGLCDLLRMPTQCVQ